MAAPQPRPSDSFVERFSTLVRGSPKRRVDLELRVLDVLIAGFFLLILSPLIGLIALALVTTSGRPLLYRGERVGRDGRIFQMLKFRTLRRGAEERLGPYLGEELVQRTREETTRVGRRLRAAQLDELPQLWNVLRGDMSLVGPRPIRPRFFEQLAAELPAYWQRLVVRPGLTGFAQVRRGYETSMAEKLAHDLEWIADRSVPLYLRTLTATAFRIAGQTLRSLGRSGRLDSARCAGSAESSRRAGPPTPTGSRAMSATLVHRGPDSDGSLRRRARGLAARRLAIIDLETGDQPIANEDGTIHVVQNGELYNYRELRGELERAGHPSARTATPRCSSTCTSRRARPSSRRLRGMFAVALWDSTRRRLVLARDRYGIKPLYYRADGDGLEFASELRSLPRGRDRPRRARGVPRLQLDPRAADDLPRGAQAPAGARARLGGRQDRASSATRGPRRSRSPSCATTTRRS